MSRRGESAQLCRRKSNGKTIHIGLSVANAAGLSISALGRKNVIASPVRARLHSRQR